MELTPQRIATVARQSPPTDKDRYAQAYSMLAHRLPDNPVVLELGMGQRAASLRMWRQLFGAGAKLYGAEIVEHFAAAGKDICDQVFCGDLEDKAFRKSIIAGIGTQPDMIIDDGSHYAKHIHLCFADFFPVLKSGGIYVIEDLETNNNPKYHQGYEPRPLAWISQIMQSVCVGAVRSPAHELYFHRNLAAIIKQ